MHPTSKPVILDLGVVRDQGPRPTCLSFAISDVHKIQIPIDEHLSPESLHQAATIHGNSDVEDGVSIASALSALMNDGQTTEGNWPYNSPQCLDTTLPFYSRAATVTLFDPAAVASCLAVGIPVVAILNIGEEFFLHSGEQVLNLTSGATVEACHAVAITGHRSIAGQNEFLIRNSWGARWGMNGLAWISSDYLQSRSTAVIQVI